MSTKADKVKIDVEQETARDEVTFEQISVRAYEIHISGAGRDELGNWLRAEKELNTERHPEQSPEAGHEAEQDAHAAE